MKALTVRQPHAQLIALGVKTIETRTKPTKFRGPLLIHAGKAVPVQPDQAIGGEWIVDYGAHGDHSVLTNGGYPESEGVLLVRLGDLTRDADVYPVPLGAIIASCKLVDCVPVIGAYDPFPPIAVHGEGRVIRLFSENSMSLVYYNSLGTRTQGIGDQRPYGDFTPGRFAWLLENIKPVEQRCPACWGAGARAGIPSHQLTAGDSFSAPPCPICHSKRTCDPIPAKGKQGLWEWTA